MNISKKLVLPLTISSLIFAQSSLAGETVKSEDSTAAEKTQHAYQEAKEESKEAMRDIKQGSKEVWGDVKEGSKKAWHSSKQAFSEGVIAGKLETALVLNKHLNPFDIDIEVEQNEVILTGEVDSDIKKDLAENIAKGIDGVSKVDNQLKVSSERNQFASEHEHETRRDFSQYVDDVTTTAAIKTELLANDNIKGLDINVDTFKDTVTLSGVVESSQQKMLAESIVKKHDGVVTVVNKLQVNS